MQYLTVILRRFLTTSSTERSSMNSEANFKSAHCRRICDVLCAELLLGCKKCRCAFLPTKDYFGGLTDDLLGSRGHRTMHSVISSDGEGQATAATTFCARHRNAGSVN